MGSASFSKCLCVVTVSLVGENNDILHRVVIVLRLSV